MTLPPIPDDVPTGGKARARANALAINGALAAQRADRIRLDDLARRVAALEKEDAAPAPGGDTTTESPPPVTPSAGLPVILDPALLQRATSLADYDRLLKAAGVRETYYSTGPYGVGFTVNADGNGTRGLVLPWKGRGSVAKSESQVDASFALPSDAVELEIVHRWLQGRTATGGGVGAVGDYELVNRGLSGVNGGHKFVRVLRAEGGRGFAWKPMFYHTASEAGGLEFMIDANEPAFPGVDEHGRPVLKQGLWDFRRRSGVDPAALVGRVFETRFYVRASSGESARDGAVSLTVDGKAVIPLRQDVAWGPWPFRTVKFPMTFDSPARDFTLYCLHNAVYGRTA